MKRILSGLLVFIFAFTQLTTIASADVPLSVSDRVTDSLADLQQRQEDIERQKQAQKALVDSALLYGKTTGKTNDLSFYINRKSLTKREYEVFKWSFIFSQFARPFQDTLLDVFEQKPIKDMCEKDFNMTSVYNSIMDAGLTAFSDDEWESRGLDLDYMMLQDVNVNELYKVTKANYALYPIYNYKGSRISLTSLLNGDMGLYEPMYLYDTTIERTGNYANDTDKLNEAYYSQQRLTIESDYFGDEKIAKTTNISVPIAFYDASFVFYLQAGLAAYLKSGDTEPTTSDGDSAETAKTVKHHTLADVIAEYGSNYLAVDSYGNICIQKGNTAGVIIVPNSGNTVLMNVVEGVDESNVTKSMSNNKLDSRINLYHNWVVSQYSEIQRASYTGHLKDIYDKEVTVTTDDQRANHFGDLELVQGNDLTGTFVLTQGPMADPGSYMLLQHKAVDNQSTGVIYNQANYIGNYASALAGIASAWSHTTASVEAGLDTTLNAFITNKDSDRYKDYGNKVTYRTHADIFNPEVIIKHAAIVSPYSASLKAFAPFTATNNTMEDLTNPAPRIISNLATYIGTNNKQNQARGWLPTQLFQLSKGLTNTKWKYTHYNESEGITSSRHYTSGISRTNDSSSLNAANNNVVMFMYLKPDQLISDNRFIQPSAYSDAADGVGSASFWLPSDIIDIGQKMKAFEGSEEKGMFLVDYNLRYSGTEEAFGESVVRLLDNFWKAYFKNVNDKAQETMLQNGNGLNDWGSMTTGIYIYLCNTADYDNSVATDATYKTAYQWCESLTEENIKFLISPKFWDAMYQVYMVNSNNNIDHMPFGGNWFGDDNRGLGGKYGMMGIKSIVGYQTKSGESTKYEVMISDDWSNQKELPKDLVEGSVKEFYWPYNGGTFNKSGEENGIVLVRKECNAKLDDTASQKALIMPSALDYYKSVSGDTTTHLNKTTYTALDPGAWYPYTKMAIFQVFLDVVKSELEFKKGEELKELDYGKINPSNLKSAVGEACDAFEELGVSSETSLNILYSLMQTNSISWFLKSQTDSTPLGTIYDEYTYYLRSNKCIEGQIACKNAETFANITYYWDRHYLTNSAFNLSVASYLADRWDSIQSVSEDYNKYLEEKLYTSAVYPLSKYLEEHPEQGRVGTDKDRLLPFLHEYMLQPQTFAEWGQTEHGTNISNMNSVIKFYEYLSDDTIIIPAFGWEDKEYTIKLYAGLGDSLARASFDLLRNNNETEINNARTRQKINPIRTIMSLQKNADYVRNILSTTYTPEAQKEQVSKEDLMASISTFVDKPVTSLSFIIAGFMYEAHEVVATGNLGSLMSVNMLLKSEPYQWVISRYVTLVTIALAVVLFLKLLQFVLSKQKAFRSLGHDILGALAACLVPIIVFNSFVWAFDKTTNWALRGTMNKILLAQVDANSRSANNDAYVTAELNAFMEQFEGIDGDYSCMMVEQLAGLTPTGEPVYTTVPITSYLRDIEFSAAKTLWYTCEGFMPVHQNKYRESYFYYFYDVIKSAYYKYANDKKLEPTVYINQLTRAEVSKLGYNNRRDTVVLVQGIENALNMQAGNFTQMLQDVEYVYGNTASEEQTQRYGGAHARDMVGMYHIFEQPSINTDYRSSLHSASVFQAVCISDLMTKDVPEGTNGSWINSTTIDNYVQKTKATEGGVRGAIGGPIGATYPVATSMWDLYNSAVNSEAHLADARNDFSKPILTPLEEKLCAVTEDIYNTTMKALSRRTDTVRDEAAICLMAFIANFKFCEAFGLEPSAPLEETLYLDAVIRTAFINDLAEAGSNQNTLYAMINQGDSVGRIAIVLLFEFIVTVAAIIRIGILLYLTVASFVILALRILHKAPLTVDLVYGIIGNILALLFMHALLLFMIVIAVEWVATATSAIPGIMLDILMILFVIGLVFMLFKLVKNLVKDAINLGGAKIRGQIKHIASAIANVAGKIAAPIVGAIESRTMAINAQRAIVQPAGGPPLADTAGTAQLTDAQIERIRRATITLQYMREADQMADQESEQENDS